MTHRTFTLQLSWLACLQNLWLLFWAIYTWVSNTNLVESWTLWDKRRPEYGQGHALSASKTGQHDWDAGATLLTRQLCTFPSEEREDKQEMWADKQICGAGFGLKTQFPTPPVISAGAPASLSEVQLSSISPVNNCCQSGGKWSCVRL